MGGRGVGGQGVGGEDDRGVVDSQGSESKGGSGGGRREGVEMRERGEGRREGERRLTMGGSVQSWQSRLFDVLEREREGTKERER